ncbi:MAG: helix-turn-helix domain-containing protein [Cyanobacteria bacterium SZAS LIN-2]|nr:helix-turn-helix domain-containing protein [Cyanobacteria bacterium SZAS LIN-2]MBS2008936.1 helix-turn-helix domain-containing protein [Cyanobacteria bacterium SZAS TMP-1]
MTKDNALGIFLRDRRAKLDPAAFGFDSSRRRTPGLRREEVAHRASVSATWYTWLEQGRGGSPSQEVLERLAEALAMTTVERDHLFVLATGRPPAPSSEVLTDIAPRLQHVLDALEYCPALIKNCAWDVVAANKAASVVFPPYVAGNFEQRNLLKNMFANPAMRDQQPEWEAVARFVVAAFRADAARAGFDITSLVRELSELSPEFAAMWQENDVIARTEHTKLIRHPEAGIIEFDFSAFAVDGRVDLNMVIYTPVTEADREKIRKLVTES